MATESNELTNHLAFLERHRGTLRWTEDGVLYIESHIPGFSFAMVDRPVSGLERFEAVHLHPGSELAHPPGFERHGTIVYMALHKQLDGYINDSLIIQRAVDEKNIDIFTEVQLRSFVPDARRRDWWRPWLRAANHRNREDPAEHFLLAWHGDVPVGVTLLLLHAGTAGIYSVATLPEYRRQGIAGTLLAHVTRLVGTAAVTLQVLSGSDAERLYSRLGFEPLFSVPILKRVQNHVAFNRA